jgi:5,10-methylenetetrahydromethanopterin reductase
LKRVTAVDIGLLPQESITACADLAEEAEALGFGGVWIADSQSVFRDAYLALALAASKTTKLTLATGVTNPVTRHPAVIGGLAGTLAEVSEGRMILGIGVGESAVYNVGLKPATITRFEEMIAHIRRLLEGEKTVFDGCEIGLSWPTPPVPIYVAASGPRALRLAGRVGDGVLFQVGATPEFVEYALAEVAAGAEEAGRTLDQIELCMRLGVFIDEDRRRARREILAYASVAANTLARTIPAASIPDDLAPQFARLKEAYDYGEHGYATADHRRLLTDDLLDAVAVAGTPDEAVPRLAELSRMGINRFVIPVNVEDKSRALRILARDFIDSPVTDPSARSDTN